MNLQDLASLAASGELKLAPNAVDSPEETGKSRKAGQVISVTPADLDELLVPWREYEPNRARPNYEGRSKREWEADNREIRSELQEMGRKRASKESKLQFLQSKGFLNPTENNNNTKSKQN